MKRLLALTVMTVLSATLSIAQNVTAGDKLLFVFEVTRHGARYGLHRDYFNETKWPWKEGELTDVGKRQQYLLGAEMRNRYMVKNPLLDATQYRKEEVLVRATDINRTIESAMSQLRALYPTGKSLEVNQTSKALPTIKVDPSVITAANADLQRASLPGNYNPVPVHVQRWMNDKNQATDSCPIVAVERKRRQSDPKINDILMAKHSETVRSLALLIGKDPATFTALESALYIDTIWARYFEQIYPMEPFNKTFIDQMMLLNLDYFNQTLTMNTTTRRLYVTGVVSKVV